MEINEWRCRKMEEEERREERKRSDNEDEREQNDKRTNGWMIAKEGRERRGEEWEVM